MGKCCRIFTVLWPLINVNIPFLLSIVSILDTFSSNVVKKLILGRSDLV